MIKKAPLVKLSNVTIYQGNNNKILLDVNFSLQQGEVIYLIGKTGSGKTSLLKTLYGELPFVSGEGSVCGFDLSKLKWKHIPLLRRQIGIVFEDFQLLTDRNVFQNLDFVLLATGWDKATEREERILDILIKVGLKDKIFKLPFELSGGEKQRLDIARSILNSPKLIIADEPTGKLDPQTSYDIIKLLFDISKRNNTSIIISSHDYVVLSKFPARIFKTENKKLWESKKN